MDDPIMVVVPVGHPLAGVNSVTPADLPSDAWINTAVDFRDLAASPIDRNRGSGHRLDFDGMDFRTALNLVAAGLGVALLPRLLLLAPPSSVVVLPMRQPTLVRRLYTCRLDTRGVTAPIRQLEAYLREAATEL
jgi:DNA-binding transcriptional LysR family regulator